jgi:hypothetical protein
MMLYTTTIKKELSDAKQPWGIKSPVYWDGAF